MALIGWLTWMWNGQDQVYLVPGEIGQLTDFKLKWIIFFLCHSCFSVSSDNLHLSYTITFPILDCDSCVNCSEWYSLNDVCSGYSHCHNNAVVFMYISVCHLYSFFFVYSQVISRFPLFIKSQMQCLWLLVNFLKVYCYKTFSSFM